MWLEWMSEDEYKEMKSERRQGPHLISLEVLRLAGSCELGLNQVKPRTEITGNSEGQLLKTNIQ